MAMTGETTLSGLVLPVGGLKEKVLAAKRAGVTDVVMPRENEVQVREDLKSEQLGSLKIHYVDSIEQVIELVLEKPKTAKPAAKSRAKKPRQVAARRRPAAFS